MALSVGVSKERILWFFLWNLVNLGGCGEGSRPHGWIDQGWLVEIATLLPLVYPLEGVAYHRGDYYHRPGAPERHRVASSALLYGGCNIFFDCCMKIFVGYVHWNNKSFKKYFSMKVFIKITRDTVIRRNLLCRFIYIQKNF